MMELPESLDHLVSEEPPERGGHKALLEIPVTEVHLVKWAQWV